MSKTMQKYYNVSIIGRVQDITLRSVEFVGRVLDKNIDSIHLNKKG